MELPKLRFILKVTEIIGNIDLFHQPSKMLHIAKYKSITMQKSEKTIY